MREEGSRSEEGGGRRKEGGRRREEGGEEEAESEAEEDDNAEEVPEENAEEVPEENAEKEDLGQTLRKINQPPNKWTVYEQILRIPYYFVFDRYTDTFQAFGLMMNRYQPLTLEG